MLIMLALPFHHCRCTPTEDPLDIRSTIPNDLMAEYYGQRASGGLLISEATAISEAGSGWRNAPHISSAEHVEGWKKVTEKVHSKDGKIFCQLWHMGRQSHSSYHPSTGKIFSASDIPMEGQVTTATGEKAEGEIPTPLSMEEIEETIRDYVNAAKLAAEAGFDGVEVHAANGYLIDQFLQSCSNKRTDKYGGSLDNNIRLLKEGFEAIVESGSFPASRIGFRFSPNGSFGGMGSEDHNAEAFIHFAKVMNELKPAYMHVMDGLGFGFHEKCSALTCADFRKVFDSPIMANVGLTKEVAEGMLRSGAADLMCFGRLFMSNPDLPERIANNWPLEPEAAYETWWGPTGEKGYTDFPTYSEKEVVDTSAPAEGEIAETQ